MISFSFSPSKRSTSKIVSSVIFWTLSERERLSSCPRSPSFSAFLRSEEHTSELQSLMRISYAVFCLKKKNIIDIDQAYQDHTHIQNPANTQHIELDYH